MDKNGIPLECPQLDRLVLLEEDLFLEKLWGGHSYLSRTNRGVWFLRGALCSEGFLKSLENAGTWVELFTYRTAWAISPRAGCCCMRTERAGAWGFTLESGAGHCQPVFGGQLHPFCCLGVQKGKCRHLRT